MNEPNRKPQDRLRKVDELCDQFEAETAQGRSPRIADYLGQAPDDQAAELFNELMLLEVALGTASELAEYLEAFPQYERIIRAIAEQTDIQEDSPEEKRERIGPYRLLQVIGEGGMGRVYLAEQTEPVRRRVAVKLIKAGMDSTEVFARFEAERQALAMMEHQNIARVLDAGISEDGRPFFAMELVKGVPITQYCDNNQLTTKQRLALFVRVCRAIQHAHQKGIIHRDIKPSNVLVSQADGEPVPKIIDFGLAKALQSRMLTDKTVFTRFGEVVGTLEYMSPEQAELNIVDIDTRSDVYSLGVLLYELLTGSTPIGRDRLKREGFQTILQIIKEEEAPRPSIRLGDSGETAADISRQRRTDSAKLSAILRGDLDWIAIRALEKERDRRYETPSALADDVQRYLDDEPIVARPPSRSYRMKKFVRKNRGLVSAIVTIALLLVVGVLGTSWFAWDANTARHAAELSANEAMENANRAIRNRQDALKVIDGFFTTVSDEELLNTPGLQPLRLQLLERAAQYYESLLSNEDNESNALLIVDARGRYGYMLSKLGRMEEAQRLLAQSAAELARIDLQDDASLATIDIMSSVYSSLTLAAFNAGQMDIAEQTARNAIDRFETLMSRHDAKEIRSWQADSLLHLCRVHVMRGHEKEARATLARVDRLLKDQPTTFVNQQLRAEVLEQLATDQSIQDRLSTIDKAIALRRHLLEERPGDLNAQFDLGSVLLDRAWMLFQAGQSTESQEAFGEARHLLESLYTQNPAVRMYRNRCAWAFDLSAYSQHQIHRNNVDEMERTARLRDSLAMYDRAERVLLTDAEQQDLAKVIPSHRSLLAMIYNGKALVNRDLEDLEKSLAAYRDALALQEQVIREAPDQYRYQLDASGTWHNMGRTLAAFAEWERAADHFIEAIRLQRELDKRLPDLKDVRMLNLSSQLDLNLVLLNGGDLKRLGEHYREVKPLLVELAGAANASMLQEMELTGEMQHAIFFASQGMTDELDTLIPKILELTSKDNDSAKTLAEMISGVLSGLASDPANNAAGMLQLEQYGQQLTDQLQSVGVLTSQDIRENALLSRWAK